MSSRVKVAKERMRRMKVVGCRLKGFFADRQTGGWRFVIVEMLLRLKTSN